MGYQVNYLARLFAQALHQRIAPYGAREVNTIATRGIDEPSVAALLRTLAKIINSLEAAANRSTPEEQS